MRDGGADPRVDGSPRRLPRPPPPAARGARRQLLQGQDVGAGGRRVDGVPPAGARGELAQAAIRMRPGALARYAARVCAYC